LYFRVAPGWAIVIPLNIIGTQSLLVFVVNSVPEEISLEDLAILFSVDLNEFKYYNAIDSDSIPRAGDWLFVPQDGSPIPQVFPREGIKSVAIRIVCVHCQSLPLPIGCGLPER